MKRKKITLNGLFLILILGLIAGCTETPSGRTKQDKHKPTVNLKGDDIILASVNGSPITKYELEKTIQKSLGKYFTGKLDKEGRKKVLESLVMSRAIALAQEKDLSDRDQAVLDKKLKAHREELLVMQYLATHAPPEPVSREMIKEYYDKHPERFGGKTIRTYEMISTKQMVRSQERDELIELLKKPAEKKDWSKWANDLQKKGYPVTYRQGQMNKNVLHSKLFQLMSSLKKGETSQLSFIKGLAYLVRMADEKLVEPRPLKEVSAQLRKSLAPIQFKKAIKQASEQVLEKVEVIYE